MSETQQRQYKPATGGSSNHPRSQDASHLDSAQLKDAPPMEIVADNESQYVFETYHSESVVDQK